MSARRTARRLLRLYPPAWRTRYGEELEALILEMSGERRIPWRARLDVAAAGARERLRAAGPAGPCSPGDQVRGGALLVLWAWARFVVAGSAVQKCSEHWQDATPSSGRALPTDAFDALVIAAACGAVLVVVGIAATLSERGRLPSRRRLACDSPPCSDRLRASPAWRSRRRSRSWRGRTA